MQARIQTITDVLEFSGHNLTFHENKNINLFFQTSYNETNIDLFFQTSYKYHPYITSIQRNVKSVNSNCVVSNVGHFEVA